MAVQKLLGGKIRQLRLENGLTQEKLAEKINIESPSYLSKIERGEASPSYELLERIADVFDLEIKDLFDFKNRKKGSPLISPSPLDKWLLKIRFLMRDANERDMKLASSLICKVFQKK